MKSVKKLVFVSGRHFYTLKEKQVELNRQDIALIRLESLCPFPSLELQRIVKKYTSATGESLNLSVKFCNVVSRKEVNNNK